MSIGKRLRILNFSAIGLVIALAVIIVMAVLNQRTLNLAQEIRYESYLRANELRHGSDELTRLARTYVITEDPKYEAMYWDILDVRNGKKPRPDGQTVALKKLMENLGFTEQEFAKLSEAETNSNNLVTTETIAMNAVKGLYDDGTGKYTKKDLPNVELARRIMHDNKYHQDKAIITKPIDEFEALLNARTAAAVKSYVLRGNILLGLIGFLALCTALSLIFMVRSTNGVLREIVGKLRSSVETASHFGAEVAKTSSNLSTVSTNQAASIEETVQTLNEINSMVEKSRENVLKSNEVAKVSQEKATLGKDSVRQVLHAISEIEASSGEVIGQMDESNKQLSEIIKIISGIETKTKVINEIVFQTKLLSFNASVEAARAGEHGKGFAVVAEEVGNLAEMSGNSAKEISQMLEGSIQKVEDIIKATTGKVHRLVEESRKKVTHGTNVANQCDEALTNVVQVVSEVNDSMSQIAIATDEQAKGVNEITKAMHQLNDGTLKNTQMAAVTADTATDLGRVNEDLKALVITIETEILGLSKEQSGEDAPRTAASSSDDQAAA